MFELGPEAATTAHLSDEEGNHEQLKGKKKNWR